MALPTFEQVHTVLDTTVTILIPTALWVYRKTRKAEQERIEAIARQEAEIVKRILEEHERKDDERFGQHSVETLTIMDKIDKLDEERQQQHRDNTSKLVALAGVPGKIDILMEWFGEWRKSKF